MKKRDSKALATEILTSAIKDGRRATPREKLLAASLLLMSNPKNGETSNEDNWTEETIRDIFQRIGISFTSKTLNNWVRNISKCDKGATLDDILSALQHGENRKGNELIRMLEKHAGRTSQIKIRSHRWYFWSPREVHFFTKTSLFPPRLIMKTKGLRASFESKGETSDTSKSGYDLLPLVSAARKAMQKAEKRGKKDLQIRQLPTVWDGWDMWCSLALKAMQEESEDWTRIDDLIRSRMQEFNIVISESEQESMRALSVTERQLQRRLNASGFQWTPESDFRPKFGNLTIGKWMHCSKE